VGSTVLSDQESACRAAHEQVQLLQHLYQRLAEETAGGSGFDARRRLHELQADRHLLVGKLRALGLLRTEPDPEREGLLDIATGLKRAFGADDNDAVTGRLVTEEREFLRHCEQLAHHDEDQDIRKTMDRTHSALERLESI
jgi:hypothetical protein